MKKRYTYIFMLAIILMLALTLITTSLVAQNREGKRRYLPKKLAITAECYAEAGITQETLDAINELRILAVEQLRAAETRKEYKAIIEQLRADIKALFTEEQLVAIMECMQSDKPATCMDQIELTPEQIEAIDSIRAAALEAIKEAENFMEVRHIIERMHQAVEDVLTEEQLEKLRECRQAAKPVDCMDQIGLSEDQLAEIDFIRETAIQEAKQATTREEIRAIMDKMAEDTIAVLTPEQLEALNECRDARLEDSD